jgi:hypothetical protein
VTLVFAPPGCVVCSGSAPRACPCSRRGRPRSGCARCGPALQRRPPRPQPRPRAARGRPVRAVWPGRAPALPLVGPGPAPPQPALHRRSQRLGLEQHWFSFVARAHAALVPFLCRPPPLSLLLGCPTASSPTPPGQCPRHAAGPPSPFARLGACLPAIGSKFAQIHSLFGGWGCRWAADECSRAGGRGGRRPRVRSIHTGVHMGYAPPWRGL